MQSVLMGFVLIWVASFLIFAWMIWRAPVMEEFIDDGETPPDVPRTGKKKTA